MNHRAIQEYFKQKLKVDGLIYDRFEKKKNLSIINHALEREMWHLNSLPVGIKSLYSRNKSPASKFECFKMNDEMFLLAIVLLAIVLLALVSY